MFKKIPSDKISGTKNALFFLLRAPTHRSFTFNLRFLNVLKHMVRLSKTVFRIFHFRLRFIFNNVTISFKIKLTQKPHSFPPRPLIFKLQQEV